MTTAAAFESVGFAAIEGQVKRHLATLPSAIDSFLEDHILASRHYQIEVAGAAAGFASIHEGKLITQFSVDAPFRHLAQPLFAALRHLQEVRSAFVPTCDELYLSHALDDYRQIARQAYFFAASDRQAAIDADSFAVRLAAPSDIPLVHQESSDFFAPVEQYVARQQLFVTMRHEDPVGFGLMVRSALYDDVASIGMYTIERCRQQGVGTATIALLMDECRRRHLRPVAGCWYYNHRSKQTLERAGMYSATRLLKIDY